MMLEVLKFCVEKFQQLETSIDGDTSSMTLEVLKCCVEKFQQLESLTSALETLTSLSIVDSVNPLALLEDSTGLLNTSFNIV
jgi:hypothetical protein